MPVMAGILPDPLTPGFWNKAKAEIPAGTISVLRLMFEDVDIAVFLRWWILQSYYRANTSLHFRNFGCNGSEPRVCRFFVPHPPFRPTYELR